MKNLILVLMVALTLVGCGKDCETVHVTEVVQAPGGNEPAKSDVQRLIDDENSYRLGLGQTMLSNGLSCSVQQVSSGQWLSSSSPGYPGSGTIVLTGTNYTFLLAKAINAPSSSDPFSLLPTALQPVFAGKNFRMNCSGQIVIPQDGYVNFSLDSDDGSILTVGGTQVINNDGNHGMTLKTGSKFFRRGVHSISLNYAQTGGGPQGLVLLMDGADVPAAQLLH